MAPKAAGEQRLNLCVCLPTMTQVGHEHATQCVRLVQADALRTARHLSTDNVRHYLFYNLLLPFSLVCFSQLFL